MKNARVEGGHFIYCGLSGLACEVLRDEVPVHQVPERFDEFRTSIAVIDVIGVLPNVTGQQRLVACSHRVAGTDGARQTEAAVGLLDQPRPAGAEGTDSGLGELFLELVEGAEGRVDGISQRTSRLAAGVRRQAIPEEGVVPDLSGVVEDAAGGGLDDAFQVLAFELGARDQVVQVGDVGSVMLVVVELERLG